jgi:hypothetical protein
MNLNLQLNFVTDIALMDFSKLRTDNVPDYERPELIEVVNLDVMKVLNSLDNGRDFEREKFNLNNNMHELLKLVENGERIIPPLIVHIHSNKWALIDGNHRFALINFLGITNAPFLIRKANKKAAINL